MIAKRIPRDKATSNLARLARYVVAAQGREDPRTWTRTADYILDLGGEGEKVGGVRVTNCHTDDPAMATLEILAVQARNTRSKGDKSYHLVFSFPEGEQPPLEVLHEIEDALVASIGLADHQRISAVHIDTDNLHVHVAINKVHPTTFNNVEPYYDMPRLMEACERLEIQHGLQRTNHGLSESLSRRLTTQQENEKNERRRAERAHPGHRYTDGELRGLSESYARATSFKPPAADLNGLRNLSSVGLVQLQGGREGLLHDHASEHVESRGSEGVDGLRRPGHGIGGTGSEAREGVTGRAAEMEAHSGRESLLGWVKREIAPKLAEAKSWEALHSKLGEFGLAIKPYGAGLVIADASSGRSIKASSVDRNLSMRSLGARLGPYVAPKFGSEIRVQRTYASGPKHQHVDTSILFRDYQRYRDGFAISKAQRLAEIKREDEAAIKAIKAKYAAGRGFVKTVKGGGAGGRVSRKLAFATIAASRKQEIANQRQRTAQLRQQAHSAGGAVTWQAWLEQQAATGNEQALAVMRSRSDRADKLRKDILTAADAGTARNIVFRHLNPTTQKDGSLRYRTADGGVVVDRASQVQTTKTTAGAAFVALTLASERFTGQPLIVEGSDAFKKEVAQAAALNGSAVKFADPAMEALRLEISAEKQRSRPTEVGIEAVKKYIESRNASGASIQSIDYYRLWTPADAGAAEYRGRRRLDDGSEVLLLRKDGQTLVKPSSAAVVAKASTWTVGDTVTLDERGRFVDTSRGRTR